jgi:acyl dehydratase
MTADSTRLEDLKHEAQALVRSLRDTAVPRTQIARARRVIPSYRAELESLLAVADGPDRTRILDAVTSAAQTELPCLSIAYGARVAEHAAVLAQLCAALQAATADGPPPIEPERVLRASLPMVQSAWYAEMVIAYHLGIGAGAAPTDPGDVRLTNERDLYVLPTFATTLPARLLGKLDGGDGFAFEWDDVLHVAHDLEVRVSLPAKGKVRTSGRVTAVHDDGQDAVVTLEAVSHLPDRTVACVNRYSLRIRGAGGFGGASEPAAEHTPPGREPDVVVERATLPQQALVYRLSRDRGPLHVDPVDAGEPDRPVLPPLCGYGIACKAVVDELLDGDAHALVRFQARFAGAVHPGETLIVEAWRAREDQIILGARTKERGSPVITNAAITLRT